MTLYNFQIPANGKKKVTVWLKKNLVCDRIIIKHFKQVNIDNWIGCMSGDVLYI